MSDIERTFKESFRKACDRHGIHAKDVVDGTGLSEAQVSSVFNPNNKKGVKLSTAQVLARYLQKRTGSRATIDFLCGDQPTIEYIQFTERALRHLKERAEGLAYYENNLRRLWEEQEEICSYLDKINAEFQRTI
ncbi:MAG: hypothetical protein CL581_18685 [Alteromonadaceae bacterium]|nr:hypothetical protein [Alteromonadaceae bacterium]